MPRPVSPGEVKRYIEETLARHPWLPRPRHVLVFLDVIEYREPGGRVVRFSGLQPGWLPDTVVLSWPLVREDTLVHEIIHTLGLGETAAWSLAPRLVELRRRAPPLITRRPTYRLCTGGPGCPYRRLHEKYGAKLLHYVLERT